MSVSDSVNVQEQLRVEVTSKKHAFIAAPFFSPGEVEVVDRIESVLDQAGCPFFSAMREPPNPLTPEKMKDPQILHEISEMCLKGVKSSFAMIAWLDRIQPPDIEVILVKKPFISQARSIAPPQPPLSINGGEVLKRDMVRPDEGVMFEIGYGSALGMPIFGFTLRGETLNPMLSQNLWATARNWEQLNDIAMALGSCNPMEEILVLMDRWRRIGLID